MRQNRGRRPSATAASVLAALNPFQACFHFRVTPGAIAHKGPPPLFKDLAGLFAKNPLKKFGATSAPRIARSVTCRSEASSKPGP